MRRTDDIAPGKPIKDMTDAELCECAEIMAEQFEASLANDGKGRGVSDLLRELVKRWE